MVGRKRKDKRERISQRDKDGRLYEQTNVFSFMLDPHESQRRRGKKHRQMVNSIHLHILLLEIEADVCFGK